MKEEKKPIIEEKLVKEEQKTIADKVGSMLLKKVGLSATAP